MTIRRESSNHLRLQAASAATARGGLPATPGAGLSALADGFDRAGGHFPSRTVTE